MSQVLFCQGSSLPGIIYIGRTPTTEHDQLYPNTNVQRIYLTTIRFLLVYDNNLYDFSIFHPPGKQELTVNIHFQLSHLNRIHTEEVDLLKF